MLLTSNVKESEPYEGPQRPSSWTIHFNLKQLKLERIPKVTLRVNDQTENKGPRVLNHCSLTVTPRMEVSSDSQM